MLKYSQEQQKMFNKLIKLHINSNIANKLILSSITNSKVEELLKELFNAKINQVIEILANLIMQEQPTYMNKQKVLTLFDVSERKLNTLIQKRLIPFYALSTKVRVFKSDEMYEYLEKYKVQDMAHQDQFLIEKLVSEIKINRARSSR